MQRVSALSTLLERRWTRNPSIGGVVVCSFPEDRSIPEGLGAASCSATWEGPLWGIMPDIQKAVVQKCFLHFSAGTKPAWFILIKS